MLTYKLDKDLQYYKNIHIPITPLSLKFLNFLSDRRFAKAKSNNIIAVTHNTITNRDDYKMKALLFEPAQKNSIQRTQDSIYSKTLIIFYHGGGFTNKIEKHHLEIAKFFVKGLGCKALLPDYRLSPTYTYKTIINDAFDTYKFALENAARLHIDKTSIILIGDSAGGNLCLEVALQKEFSPKGIMLFYPVIDNSLEYDSMKKYTNAPIWNSNLNIQMWEWYLRGVTDYVPVNKRENLQDLQNVYIETAQYDCLNNEGIAFAKKLQKLGVHTTLNQTQKSMHAYDIAYKSDFMKRINKERITTLKSFL